MDKSKVYDIFKQTEVNGISMYSQNRTLKDIIVNSMEIKNKERQMRNIQLIKKLCPHLFIGYNNLIYI